MTSIRIALSYEEAKKAVSAEKGPVFFSTEPVTHRQHHTNNVVKARTAGIEPPQKPEAVEGLREREVAERLRSGHPVPHYDENDPKLDTAHHYRVNTIALPSQGLVIDLTPESRPTDEEFANDHSAATRVTRIG